MPNTDYVAQGGEFLVNTSTTLDQIYSTITSLASGGFVVSWMDYTNSPNYADVRAQKYDAAGTKVGGEVLVNTNTVGDQFYPAVAGLASGGYVVSWTDQVFGGASGAGVKAQIFANTGAQLGGELFVNPKGRATTVTGLASGGFVVSWTDFADVRAQVFGPTGQQVGGQFVANTSVGGHDEPAVASLASGGFVISWTDTTNDSGDSYDLRAQVFDAAGAKLGGEFLVNTTTAGAQNAPVVTGLASGGFVVAWTDPSGLGGDLDTSVKAQIFGATGAKLGGEVLVNTTTSYLQSEPTITGLASGGFVVSWMDRSGLGGDPVHSSIKAQVFDEAGAKQGAEFLVNTITDSSQLSPAITSLASGGFVVSWTDSSGLGGDASQYGIKAQIFQPASAPVPPAISISAITHSAAEGNAATTPFSFLVTRAGDLSAQSQVRYSILNGGGVDPQDFAGPTVFTVDFALGESQKTIVVDIKGDTVVEADETFTLSLAGIVGATAGTATASAVVLNDDKVKEEPRGATAGKDTITATASSHILTGLGGSDTFQMHKSSFGGPSAALPSLGLYNYIADFQGAGGWQPVNNDTIAITGFAASATLHLGGVSATDPKEFDYYVEETGQKYWFALHSENGKALNTSQDIFLWHP